MINSHDKGARAERELEKILQGFGIPARRKLGAGRQDDQGDIDGVWNTTIQVADWKDVLAALRQKPLECEEQRLRAQTPWAVTCLRLRGGMWRFVQTPEQWATMYDAACDTRDLPCP